MTLTRRTNYFALFLFVNQYFWRLVWPYIIPALGLGMSSQGILTQLTLLVLPAAVYFIITKESVQKTLGIRPLGIRNIIIIILLSLAIQPFMSVLAAVSTIFFPNHVSDTISILRQDGYGMMLLSIAVMPAICEEVFFRGIIFHGYRLQSLGRACLFTGLLFGLMHMDGQQFLYAFALGTLFCFLRYRTNSILAPMLAHFVINGTQVSLSWFIDANAYANVPTAHEAALGLLTLVAFLGIFFVSLVVLGGMFWWFLKINPEPRMMESGILAYHPPSDWKEEFVDVPFFLIVAIYVCEVVVFPIVASWL